MAAKGKKPASRGKPRASASATKKKAAAVKAKPKAKAKPAAKKPKAKAKPAPRKREAEVEVVDPMAALVNAPDFVDVPITFDDGTEDGAAEDGAAGKKPSALARLKSGVGSLFAKMTRRGAKGATESDGVPDAPTMEIVTGDIIGSAPVRTKRSRKTPPPPPAAEDD